MHCNFEQNRSDTVQDKNPSKPYSNAVALWKISKHFNRKFLVKQLFIGHEIYVNSLKTTQKINVTLSRKGKITRQLLSYKPKKHLTEETAESKTHFKKERERNKDIVCLGILWCNYSVKLFLGILLVPFSQGEETLNAYV